MYMYRCLICPDESLYNISSPQVIDELLKQCHLESEKKVPVAH
jgi:hypothetical protein